MRQPGSTKYFRLLFLWIGILALTSTISAQQQEETARSRLEGIIADPNKQPIPQAKIQLKHVETGQVFKSESNKKGKFNFSFLLPGNYTFLVEKEGYKGQAGEFDLPPNTLRNLTVTLAQEETPEQKAEREALSLFEEGIKLAGEKQIDQAIQAFQKATELKPDLAEAYLNIGILYFQQQKDDEAEKALLKANELKPEEPKAKQILSDIYYEKSRALIEQDKVDEALEQLKRAYALNPTHAYVNYLLGFLYARKQMKEEAITHLEIFLKLEPKSPVAERAKQLLEDLKKMDSWYSRP